MLVFSPCKVNIGLNVVEKRADGFHNIETVFYPIQWKDAIEVLKNTDNQEFKLTVSGLRIEGNSDDNIIYKAYLLIKKEFNLPNIKVHLHKTIPMGAGLGGGSSNAATFINLVDKTFELNISLTKKIEIAKKLGSDCSFFIENKPIFAKEKGDLFEPIKIDLISYYILIIYPNIHSNTKIAYEGVSPKKPKISVKTIIETKPIEEWRTLLINDFEDSVCKTFPQINLLKQNMYDANAIYASMSGSGSAIFGVFKEKPNIELKKEYLFFIQEPAFKH
jgi:4-diphosphocytidyl-2-C-methyl-D-erythritol kinase